MDKHIVRQQLLRAALALEPGLFSLDAAATLPLFRVGGVTRDDLAAELRGLASHAYLRDVRPGRESLYRLTDRGRDQIGQETDLHEYVWGEFASQFQQDNPPR
jgi:hypothetical protein